MAEKIKKGIPWFLVMVLFGLVLVAVLDLDKPTVKALSEQATTTVTVGNDAPTWVAVYEDPASATTTPTNVGSNVTFKGRADDPNGENIWLVICSSSAAPATSSAGGVPTCAGSTWATSTAADNATATATYTTLVGDAENNAWWAWACDNNTNQLCTASSQGTGATDAQYSPFAVNHAPTFTALGGTTPINPGGVVGISASSTDSDSAGADYAKLFVCWALDGTSSGCGSGGGLCSATSTANPTCNYTASSTLPDTTYNYYGYIFDNHNFAANPATRTASFVVNNATPTVSNVKLNNDAAIDLTEEATTSILLTATLQDSNSCNDLSSSIGNAYRTASSSVCTAQNDNFCYYNISLNIGPCGGNEDADATTSIAIYFWYYADPTSASTPWAADTWTGSVKGIDNNNASSTATSTAVEVNTLLALDVNTGSINYGTLAAGGNTGTLSATSTLAETGNSSLDLWSTSTNMTYGATGTIAVGNQEYSLSSGIAYGSGTDASTTDQELELNLPKTTASSTQQTANVYWGLAVPGGTPSGPYTGYAKYEAKLNELPWP